MAPRTQPVSATQSAGYTIKGALWNAGPGATAAFLLAPPIFRGRQSATQSVAAGTWTALSMDVTDGDSDTGHSNVTNNTRYTCQVAGWYWVEGYVAFNGGAASRIASSIAKSGTQVVGGMQTCYKANDLQSIGSGCAVSLAVNNYVEVWGYQNSGGAVSTFNGSDLACSLNVFWIHS